MSSEIILGIDLGTTFSAVAYVNDYGKPEIIPNQEGDRTTPSVVYFQEDGTPIVGIEARHQAMAEPRRTVRFFKRDMGNSSFRVNIDGKDYFAEDLSALVLKKLKSAAEAKFPGVTKAVISVPAYFKDAQREATRQAGVIAGLDVIRIINEPTAAAIAYGVDKAEGAQTLMVYDFGGGTFDVTVMRAQGNELTVIATDGNAMLGGKDIDERLVSYFAEEFLSEHGVDLRTEASTNQDLWDKAERVKKDLSFRDNLAETFSFGEKTLRVDIDREKFEELIADLIKQTEDCMTKVMQSAGLDWAKIDRVLLAGGSSRIPAVRRMIGALSGKDAARDLNPDECVALGAALQAVSVTSEGSPQPAGGTADEHGGDLVIHDVASHSLGVKALDPKTQKFANTLIIPRLTEVPCSRTRTFATKQDNQERVEVEVLQGEDTDPNSPEVHLVGRVQLKNLPPHKAGDLIIEVTLSYDADGVIEVTARETKSGQMIREVVMSKVGSLSADIIQERKEMLAGMDV
jgi:molecular chaperone DnaK